MWKRVANAVVMYASLPVYDHRDVGGRAMQGAIAEKIRQLFRKYLLIWITRQYLQKQRGYRTAGLLQVPMGLLN